MASIESKIKSENKVTIPDLAEYARASGWLRVDTHKWVTPTGLVVVANPWMGTDFVDVRSQIHEV